MSTKNLKKIGQKNKFNLKMGIKDTIEWYKLNQTNHKNIIHLLRSFSEKILITGSKSGLGKFLAKELNVNNNKLF